MEIIKDVDTLYNNLQRVSIQMPSKDAQTEWHDLARELQDHEQVLCIVSDRKSAKELYRLMPEGTYHLSALMCAEHRSEKIDEIKKKLDGKEAIRVISTQLIEAGVDIDFPVVYKQIAGLDSIAQAAGRCNREGKLKEGKVVVFNSTKASPIGLLRKATETTQLLPQDVLNNPLAPESFKFFFETFYWKANSLDKNGIVNLLTPDSSNLGIQFREASDNFAIIDDKSQRTIFVPYKKGKDYINMVNSKIPEMALLRKLQRYSVNIYENQFQKLRHLDYFTEILPNVFALKCEIMYFDDIGLSIDEMPNDPETFIM
jgi:CRISPR-associated endonuclease/helicase Cas3